MKNSPFNSLMMQMFLLLYKAINYLLIGPLLVYLWLRGRRDPLYTQHLPERFGSYENNPVFQQQPVWVHAVSLGELRSAVPLIKALLAQGEQIVTTHFTPVGRREALSIFADDIAAGNVNVLYIPLELGIAFNRFYKAYTPKYGLVMEVEFWPCMIHSARQAGIPLFLCNGQYPTKSFQRDTKGLGLRAKLVSGFAGAMVKSNIQAQRFESLGVDNVAITGELRFEQPVPAHQIEAASQLAAVLPEYQKIITIASAVEGEDSSYIECICDVKKHTQNSSQTPVLFIYVPRAPERFETVKGLIENAGLTVATRSTLLDDDLKPGNAPLNADVFLGDSMGEMYFYLSLSDEVIVGGGLTPGGAHNISEALALSKPVIVGPNIWTIEYPAHEAIDAGVLQQVANSEALLELVKNSLSSNTVPSAQSVDDFFSQHTGAVEKTLRAIPELLSNTTSR